MARHELTRLIINESANIIGFVVKGKSCDLGGFGNEVIEKPMQIEELRTRKFINTQVDMSKGQIVELGKFRLNQLPMVMFKGNEFIEVNNGIKLTQKYVQNNKIIGFDIQFNAFNGVIKPYNYKAILALGKWFKPENFVIRHSDKGNKAFISGKGMSLDDLPTVVLGKESKAKKRKSGAVESRAVSGVAEREFDILDVYNILGKLRGQVIHLPSEHYVPVSIDGIKAEEGFTSLGIGEVASPHLVFNSTKLKVNAGFKKVGIVPVNIKSKRVNIVTFIYRTKSLFVAGSTYVKKFGIAVPISAEESLINTLGASLTLTKLEDTQVIQPLSQVINAKELAFYTVDASGLDLISKSKRDKSILSADSIAGLLKKQYNLKIIKKYCEEEIKGIKQEVGDRAFNVEYKGREVFGEFSLYTEEVLKELESLGFDIYTGAYSNPKASNETETKEKVNTTADSVEVVYTLSGYDIAKKTGAVIKKAVADSNTNVIDSELLKKLRTIYDISSPYDRYEQANKILRSTSEKLEQIEQTLWMHTASMFIEGGKVNIHTRDSGDWEPIKSRATKYEVYTSKVITGLNVKFRGVKII